MPALCGSNILPDNPGPSNIPPAGKVPTLISTGSWPIHKVAFGPAFTLGELVTVIFLVSVTSHPALL